MVVFDSIRFDSVPSIHTPVRLPLRFLAAASSSFFFPLEASPLSVQGGRIARPELALVGGLHFLEGFLSSLQSEGEEGRQDGKDAAHPGDGDGGADGSVFVVVGDLLGEGDQGGGGDRDDGGGSDGAYFLGDGRLGGGWGKGGDRLEGEEKCGDGLEENGVAGHGGGGRGGFRNSERKIPTKLFDVARSKTRK